jgi:hypothetical protein
MTKMIICRTLPPIVVGSSILMQNLFDQCEEETIALGGWEAAANKDPNFRWNNGPIKYLKFSNLIQKALDYKLNRLYFLIVKWWINWQVKKYKPSSIFAACTPEGFWYVAAFIVAKKNKIPFYGHMHDLWEENCSKRFHKKIARNYEHKIFLEANKIYGMTNHQIDHYYEKYGVYLDILPHTISPEKLEKNNFTLKIIKKENVKILYTGNISKNMNLQAVQLLVKAFNYLTTDLQIEFLTPLKLSQLQELGLFSDKIEYKWVSMEESRRKQAESDLLLLPLSFKNCSIDEVKTVFATKTLDYLVSGTPIFVLGPNISFHNWSAQTNGWGFTCSNEEPKQIAKAIENALIDSRRDQIVENAFNEAKKRNAKRWADKLMMDLK